VGHRRRRRRGLHHRRRRGADASEFAIPEFAAALGWTHDSGKAYLGDAIETRYRLPRLWEQVVAGRVPVWKARRVAQHTLTLSVEEAGFVDRHVAAVAGKIGPVQLDRLIEEARVRFDPEQAEQRRRDAAERRHLDVHTDQVATWCGLPGTRVVVRPVIDLTGHVHTDAVEVTDRLREHVVVQHHTCVFPRCTRPARRCDCDHITPTSFVWTSPYGYTYLRDHTGTTDLTPDTGPKPDRPA
jgi:hypothetical protein